MPGSAEPAALESLREACDASGMTLRGDAISLAELDGMLSAWRHDGVDRPWLVAGVAAYLALVLLADIPSAVPGPDSTVVLSDGDVVDCAAIAAERLALPNANLRGVVREVHARPVKKKRWWRRG